MTPVTLLPLEAFASHVGISVRQVKRYLAEDRLPGAAKVDGRWLIPTDARPVTVTSRDVTPVTRRDVSRDVTAMSWDVPVTSPLGTLYPLKDAAELLGTTVGGVRRLGRAGHLVVGPYGSDGGLRVFVPAR